MKNLTGKIFIVSLVFIFLFSYHTFPQAPIPIQVDVSQSLGNLNHFWGNVGQDSFNDGILAPHNQTTYDLMRDLNERLHKNAFQYIRMTCIYAERLTAWNEDVGGHVYSETVEGEPIYNWTIVDNVIDNILSKGFKPIITLTFMPDDLASDPNNRNDWNDANVSPPKDYDKWRNLNYETVKHLTERYGSAELETWYFEVWNEPDLPWFFWVDHPDTVNYLGRGDHREYFKLYDYAVDGAVAANSNIKIGGPAIAGDIDLFINKWIDHAEGEVNYATGEIGTRIDFISRHNYGGTDSILDFVSMTLEAVYWTSPSFYNKMVSNEIEYILTETGPSTTLQNWLNTRYVPAWIVKEIDAFVQLGDEKGIAYIPDVTCFWTFPTPANYGGHFGIATALGNEWNPPADGVVKRPAFNTYEMLGMMHEERIGLNGTVYGDPVHGFATKNGDQSVEVILYHLDEEDFYNENSQTLTVDLTINQIPFDDCLVQVYKIDETHSNGYTVWKDLGSPTEPTVEELNEIKSRDDLELAEPEMWKTILDGTFTKRIQIQNNSVVMVVIQNADYLPPQPYEFGEYEANDIYGQLGHFEWLAAQPEGTSGQFSSYDRTGGNVDWENYLGTKPDGSKILAQMDGPGCITRIWMTNLNFDDDHVFFDDTILRIYINNESIPVIEVPLKDFFGNYAHFVPPLAQRIKKTYISYVPIPYTQSCEVTVELGSTAGIYYHINYRSFPTSEGMNDFGLTLNESDMSDLQNFVSIWNNPGSDPYDIFSLNNIDFDVNCPAGESVALFDVEESGMITMIDFNVEDSEMLYGAYLKIYWDYNIEPAVHVPLADFFGMRFGKKLFNSIPIGIGEDRFYCYFPMPFSDRARIVIENANSEAFRMWGTLTYREMSELDSRFGRFHADYHEEYPTTRYQNYQLLEMNNKGKFVGVIVNMDNSIEDGAIWEGDEIIYFDGELEPSWNGTGSEDFFNQSWGYDEVVYPLHGTITRWPNLSCYRFMLSDIPIFNTGINAELEVGHGSQVVANYSSVVYYYLFDETFVEDRIPPSPPTGVDVIRVID
ncbi:DUF2961 domain-containing protein [bacterium]|nr:DUF2961 domain-containing protein [bacterium]